MSQREAAGLDRAAWLQSLREVSPGQENVLAPIYDAAWGQIDDTHRVFIDRFLSLLPPGGDVLDAACGTGQYFEMVTASGRSVLGVDQAEAYLAIAARKVSGARTERHDLQELPYEDEFDGVMCIDAMEFVPPEDWPVVLERFRRALRPEGRLYLTVERVADDEVRAANEEARRGGLPVVDGEVIWHDPDDYYHYYPSLQKVRAWLVEAGFAIEDELEGPWEDDAYAYHHFLARIVARATESERR